VLGVAVVTLLLVVGVIDIGIFFLARAKAQTAADAASLAAAAELIPGPARDPEGQARRFASANGAELVKCDCRKGAREVQVEVAVPAEFFMVFNAASARVPARARAGIDLDSLADGHPAGA
jgi:secretion/DNA translocation related TadE-like protein